MLEKADVEQRTISDWALLLLSWMVACTLAFSGIEHVRNPWFFLNTVFRYRFLDGVGAVALAALIPVVQLTLAVMMISGNGRRSAMWIAAAMFLFFSLAQIIALANGLEISCGCFGSFSEPISAKTIGLDLILMMAAVYCGLRSGSPRSLEFSVPKRAKD